MIKHNLRLSHLSQETIEEDYTHSLTELKYM